MLPPRPLRIALADDSRAVRTHLREFIGAHEGMQVVAEAEQMPDVETIVAQQAVDGVIIDIGMPGNGMQTLRHIKAHHPGTWVVVLTNHADPYHRDVCLRTGADAFLDKTLEYENVVGELERLAANRGVPAARDSIGEFV